ncbi:Proteinase inhibitor propeptide, partial [Penicillium sp. IBT 18751x]
AKDDVRAKGGIIKHEYSLIKGFTYVRSSLEDLAQTLDSTEHIHVEQDGVVSTQ